MVCDLSTSRRHLVMSSCPAPGPSRGNYGRRNVLQPEIQRCLSGRVWFVQSKRSVVSTNKAGTHLPQAHRSWHSNRHCVDSMPLDHGIQDRSTTRQKPEGPGTLLLPTYWVFSRGCQAPRAGDKSGLFARSTLTSKPWLILRSSPPNVMESELTLFRLFSTALDAE